MNRSAPPVLLLVEDNTALQRLLSIHLTRLGFRVLAADTGEDALHLARAQHGAVDLLITDIMLPGMTGLELAMQLRDRHPGLPAVLITAYPPEYLVKYGVRLGDFPLLNKPFTMDDLRSTLSQLLGYVIPLHDAPEE